MTTNEMEKSDSTTKIEFKALDGSDIPASSTTGNRKTYEKKVYGGRSNRFYAFRNIDRLKALKRFNVLFIILACLSIIPIVIGIGAVTIWFMLGIFGLWLVDSWNNMGNFGLICMLVGAAIVVGSLILRFLIERLYFVAERIELRKSSEGYEKYLDIMRVNTKVGLIEIVMWLLIIGACLLIYLIQTTLVTGICLVAILALFIAVRIISNKMYEKVAQQITEVKIERRSS